jgi:branched-chain amino acid transport system substrate-binding protein
MWGGCMARWIAPLVIAIAVAGGAAAQGKLKVAFVMPMTGALAGVGQQVVAGARLYMSEHGNAVAGRQIELIVKDNTTLPEVAKRLIQEAIVNDKVDVIGGGNTGDLVASAQIVTEARKPVVIMVSSTSAVIGRSPFFVRTGCTIAQSTGVMAGWAVRNGIGKVVTVVSDFAPGHEAEAAFKGPFQAAGGAVADSLRVPLQNPDFAPFLQRARDAAPQALFVFIPSVQAGAFARQFVERGLDRAGMRLLGLGDMTTDELLPQMGDAMLGAVTAHFYAAAHPSPMNRAFVDAFQRQTGERANFMAVAGYDGMHLIYEALRKTGGDTSGDALIAAMKGMSWESPRGPMSIDPATGEVIQNIYIRRTERLGGELHNIEFATFEAVKTLRTMAK